jgi:hypothetical protein
MGISQSNDFYLNYNITKMEFCKFYFNEKKNYHKENQKLFDICRWEPTDVVVQIMSSIELIDGMIVNPIFLQGGDLYDSVFAVYKKAQDNPNDPDSPETDNPFGCDGTNVIEYIVLIDKSTNVGKYYLDSDFKPILNQLLILNYNLTKFESIAYMDTVHIKDLDTITHKHTYEKVVSDADWNKMLRKRKITDDTNYKITESQPPIIHLSDTELSKLSANTIVTVIINFSKVSAPNTKTFDISRRECVDADICADMYEQTTNSISYMLSDILNKAYIVEIKYKKFTPIQFIDMIDCMVESMVISDRNPNSKNLRTEYNRKDFKQVKMILSKYNNFL